MAAIRQLNNNWLWYIDKKSFAVSDSTTQSPLARLNENLTVSMSKHNQFLLPGKSIKPMKIGCIYVKKKRKTKTNNYPKKQNKTKQFSTMCISVMYFTAAISIGIRHVTLLRARLKTNISKFQFDQESGRRRTTLWMCYL